MVANCAASIQPPDTIQTILPAGAPSLSAAAIATAPAPSATTLFRSANVRTPAAMSAIEGANAPESSVLISGHMSGSTARPPQPSTNVATRSIATGLPAAKEALSGAAVAGSQP